MVKLDDLVIIKPEFKKPGEADAIYILRSINEKTQRCGIELLTSSMPMNAHALVGINMLEPYLA